MGTPFSEAGLADSPWPCLGGNAQHTGQSPYSTENTTGALKWQIKIEEADIPGQCYADPVIGTDGTIYIGSQYYYFHALKPNGKEKWSFETYSNVNWAPAVSDDGTIYVTSYDSHLYALNPDGTLKWSFQAGNWTAGPAIGQDGTIYFGSWDSHLYALSPNGTQKWKYQTVGYVQSVPAIGTDGSIYFTSDNDGGGFARITALRPDGTRKWHFDVSGGEITGSPVIASDGTVYIGSSNHNLFAFSENGALRWTFSASESIYSSAAIGNDGTIYFGTIDNYWYSTGGVYAVNPDGSQKWKFQTTGHMSAPVMGSEGTIYIGSYNGTVYALNPEGTLKWSYNAGGTIFCSPAIGRDGTLYISSTNGMLYAFGKGSGGLSPAVIIAVGAVVIIAIAAAVTVMHLRKRPREPTANQPEPVEQHPAE